MDDSEGFLGFNIDIIMIIHTVNKHRRFTDGEKFKFEYWGHSTKINKEKII